MDFSTCRIAFEQNGTNQELYGYKGSVIGLPGALNRSHLISEQGCRTLCGTGAQWYPWETAANSITTWVLPIVGLILQAPFESNQCLKTFLATCRWVGSPISSLSYTFWNIKITGKCAIMVDMAIEYNMFPNAPSEFSQIRDSLYILSVMNQYALNPQIGEASAERILRVALFDNDLELLNPIKGIIQRRAKLAESLRSGRKRGVVPVFISSLCFLLSLAISIDAAFGSLGVNATAHNLAIGLLLCWLPVLTLSGITDRSPCSSDEVRQRLNRLLESVRLALLHDPSRMRGDPPIPEGDYFTEFCGQARSRWHYGVAHHIIVGIESDFATHHGRGWLSHPGARDMLVSGPKRKGGGVWFDFRELWQVFSAIGIVGCSILGPFIISYFTPTVGLGCRSGGYLIFFILAFTDFTAESVSWWVFPTESPTRKRLGYLLNFIEIVNTFWLVYILTAQIIGFYQTCTCWSSSWGGGGGYIDFDVSAVFKVHVITVYWSTGTILSCTAMCLGLLYIVVEWCTQSHLWAEDYGDAMAGLKTTRRFKKYTIWFRCVPDWIIAKVKTHRPRFLGEKRGRRSLVWRWKVRK